LSQALNRSVTELKQRIREPGPVSGPRCGPCRRLSPNRSGG